MTFGYLGKVHQVLGVMWWHYLWPGQKCTAFVPGTTNLTWLNVWEQHASPHMPDHDNQTADCMCSYMYDWVISDQWCGKDHSYTVTEYSSLWTLCLLVVLTKLVKRTGSEPDYLQHHLLVADMYIHDFYYSGHTYSTEMCAIFSDMHSLLHACSVMYQHLLYCHTRRKQYTVTSDYWQTVTGRWSALPTLRISLLSSISWTSGRTTVPPVATQVRQPSSLEKLITQTRLYEKW